MRFASFEHASAVRLTLGGLVLILCQGCDQRVAQPTRVESAERADSEEPIEDVPEPVERGESDERGEPDMAADQMDSRSKWVGEIPYDVFFDEPLAVASDQPAEGNNVVSLSTVKDDAAQEPPSHQPDADIRLTLPGAASSVDWRQLAEIQVLNEEVQFLRNRLTANLRTVAAYNRNIDTIRNDSALLAALAAVIAVHPGSLSWQDNANWVRDLASRMSVEAGEPGRAAFSATQLPFEQIVVILNGGRPPDGDAAGIVAFSDVADRSDLMKRVEQSFNWLKSEVNTESSFRRSPDEIARACSLLAVVGGLISTDDYDYADEPPYQQSVRNFIEGNLGMKAAVASGNYHNFITARDRVQNSCAACHGEYALGDEGL